MFHIVKSTIERLHAQNQRQREENHIKKQVHTRFLVWRCIERTYADLSPRLTRT